ncbi:MAG: hypothetical protein JHC96_04470 [Brevundimonas sp.]|nr:hypothetical protein [Brevundimonas sp.]
MQAAAQPPSPPLAWTWTLYESEGPVVLANEVTDTPALRATLQCAPRSNVATVTLYDTDARSAPETQPGFARLTSGAASTTSAARIGRGGRLEVTLRTDHPLFAAFVGSGDMAIMTGDRTGAVKVERPHLAKLRRFADRCAG